MSWSFYASARSGEELAKHIERQPVKGPETPNAALTEEQRALCALAVKLSGFTEENAPAFVEIQASGHSPNGVTQVKVEPRWVSVK